VGSTRKDAGELVENIVWRNKMVKILDAVKNIAKKVAVGLLLVPAVAADIVALVMGGEATLTTNLLAAGGVTDPLPLKGKKITREAMEKHEQKRRNHKKKRHSHKSRAGHGHAVAHSHGVDDYRPSPTPNAAIGGKSIGR
jgi:hypothetical protein